MPKKSDKKYLPIYLNSQLFCFCESLEDFLELLQQFKFLKKLYPGIKTFMSLGHRDNKLFMPEQLLYLYPAILEELYKNTETYLMLNTPYNPEGLVFPFKKDYFVLYSENHINKIFIANKDYLLVEPYQLIKEALQNIIILEIEKVKNFTENYIELSKQIKNRYKNSEIIYVSYHRLDMTLILNPAMKLIKLFLNRNINDISYFATFQINLEWDKKEQIFNCNIKNLTGHIQYNSKIETTSVTHALNLFLKELYLVDDFYNEKILDLDTINKIFLLLDSKKDEYIKNLPESFLSKLWGYTETSILSDTNYTNFQVNKDKLNEIVGAGGGIGSGGSASGSNGKIERSYAGGGFQTFTPQKSYRIEMKLSPESIEQIKKETFKEFENIAEKLLYPNGLSESIKDLELLKKDIPKIGDE